MRLLVVEDDVAIHGFLKRALVESGYQVDTASNAKTGELKAWKVSTMRSSLISVFPTWMGWI